MKVDERIQKVRDLISLEKKIMIEFNSLFSYIGIDESENNMITVQIRRLKEALKDVNDDLLKILDEINLKKPLKIKEEVKRPAKYVIRRERIKEVSPTKSDGMSERIKQIDKISELDKEVIKRLKKVKTKKTEVKEKNPSLYVKLANRIYGKIVRNLLKEKKLASLEKNLIQSNLGYTPAAYISILMQTTIISVFAGIFLVGFFLFFNLSTTLPIIIRAPEGIGARFLKTFWLLFAVPAGTFVFMYFYPSMEKKSLEVKINSELPFATIHMSAISSSLIEPIKIFKIICATKEYPYIEKEFNKLLNEINVYGYDIVTALKSLALNCPSLKLGELFNGLATTITSGGGLYEFFEKRSQTLLFEYKLEKEKTTKTAETFMDIYISVVIAAPMILMLLLMMMKISGFGVSLSTSMITLLVVGAVSLINIFFIMFLQLKQPSAA